MCSSDLSKSRDEIYSKGGRFCHIPNWVICKTLVIWHQNCGPTKTFEYQLVCLLFHVLILCSRGLIHQFGYAFKKTSSTHMFTFWNVTEIKLKIFFSSTKPYFQIPPKVMKTYSYYYLYHFSLTKIFNCFTILKSGMR